MWVCGLEEHNLVSQQVGLCVFNAVEMPILSSGEDSAGFCKVLPPNSEPMYIFSWGMRTW